MSTMLPFTSTDLLFALVVVGALLALSAVVYLLARQQTAHGRVHVQLPAEAEISITAAPVSSGAAGAIQHA